MGGTEIVNELKRLASVPQSFTVDELLNLIGLDTNHAVLERTLIDNPKFLSLGPDESGKNRFVLDSTLFQWFTNLNIQLSRAHQFRLTKYQVALLMSHLRRKGRWSSPPTKAIDWGKSLGFVGHAYTPDHYVFPLAHILSYLSPRALILIKSVLANLETTDSRNVALKKGPDKLVQGGLSKLIHKDAVYPKRSLYVVMSREGLLKSNNKRTLAQIGASLGITRERVRQIEKDIWKRIYHPAYKRPFIEAFLYDFINEGGSLLFVADASRVPLRKFIAKSIGVPCTRLPHTKYLVLGATPAAFTRLRSLSHLPTNTNADFIAGQLVSEGKICLCDSEMKTVCESLASLRQKLLTKSQKVYLSLRSIRRPAHYSEIAQEYNRLFPESPSSEHNIHSILNREAHGVVWIGIKGTFALEEWGHKHPQKSLYRTVAEIVEKIYSRTGRPVPYTVIMAELGKYRQLVNRTSLSFVTNGNPSLRRVSKNCFLPKGIKGQIQGKISVDRLDRILDEFQREG